MDAPVAVYFTPDELEQFSDSLSDVLCWMRGYMAATAKRAADAHKPFGLEDMKSLNIRFKSALNKYTHRILKERP